MQTRLSDLNKHLFAQLDRLTDTTMSADDLERETKRTTSLVSVSDQILKTAAISIKAAEIASEYGSDPSPYLKNIEGEGVKQIEGDRSREDGG